MLKERLGHKRGFTCCMNPLIQILHKDRIGYIFGKVMSGREHEESLWDGVNVFYLSE